MAGAAFIALTTAIIMATTSAPAAGAAVAAADERSWIVETDAPLGAATLAALGIEAPARDEVLSEVAEGFVADLTGAQARSLDAVPGVTLHADIPIELADTQSGAPWHLSRLDQAEPPVDARFEYPASAGNGVRVYIVDTGVSPHPDLGARLAAGFTTVADGLGTADCDGHGSHVAGLAASSTYGVAKLATIVPVRVFGCSGPASLSDVLDGLDWIAGTHPAGTPGVINLSIAGAVSPILDQAVNTLVAEGFVVAAAAGNGGTDQVGDDACGESPARAAAALTVAAVDAADARAGFSNFGSCVDLFAPGVGIRSLTDTGSGSTIMSGTSMATPLVAGAAALVWSLDPTQLGSTVSSRIISGAMTGTVTSAGTGSPNRLLNLQFASLIGIAPPSAPQSLAVTANDGAVLTLAWEAPADAGGGEITDYALEYRRVGTTAWTTVADGVSTETSYTFYGPSVGANFEFAVQARNAAGLGAAASTNATVPSPAPSAPTGLTVTANTSQRLAFGWSSPASVGAGPVTDYVLQYKRSTSTTWTTVADGVSTTTSFAFVNPSANATFDVKVFARNAYGTGPSASVRVTTPPKTPGPVAALAVAANTYSALTFAWEPPTRTGAGPITDYVLQYKRSTSTTWTTLADGVSSTRRSFTFSNPAGGTTFDFKVFPRNAYGTGTSTTVRVTTLVKKPGSPTALAVTANTASSLGFSWAPPENQGAGPITDYVLQFKRSTSTTWKTIADGVSPSRLDFAFVNPTPGVTFDFKVFARNAYGTSPSTSIQVTTPN